MINNKQFTTYKRALYSLFIVSCLLFISTEAFAQATTPRVNVPQGVAPTEYQLLEPIPQLLSPGSTSSTNAAVFLVGLFKLLIGLAGVMAVIMIIYGGVIKMSSDAVSEQSKANEIISNAIWGLIFAIAAWLILYTINPRLVEIKFDIKPVETTNATVPGAPGLRPGETAPTPGPGAAMTQEEIAASNQIKKTLENSGVGVNAGPCTQGQGYGCTNLNGLPNHVVQGLITLKKDCGCIVTVSGGTEPGPHKTHGVDKPIVDLRNEGSLRSWLTSKKYITPDGNGAVVPLSGTGRKVIFTFEKAGQGRSTGDHWHLIFQ